MIYNINNYGKKGLRTLIYAKKKFENLDDYYIWASKY